jgi:hypothetical protein
MSRMQIQDIRGWKRLQSYRHAYLLASLSLLIFGWPFLEGFGRGLLNGLLALSLLMSIAACATRRSEIWLGLFLTIVIEFFIIASPRGLDEQFSAAGYLLSMFYFGYVAFLVLKETALKSTTVTMDTIYGAVSAYLVLGLTWAQAYALLSIFEPNSYSFGGVALAADQYHFDRFLGFSFVTLTTLGYGNIVPETAKADALAYSEAIVGQLYVAVLLARLVALEIASRAHPPSGGGGSSQS